MKALRNAVFALSGLVCVCMVALAVALAGTARAGEVVVQADNPANPSFQFKIEVDGRALPFPVALGQSFVVETGEVATITIRPAVPDAGGDSRIGLEEAIRALQVVAGATTGAEEAP